MKDNEIRSWCRVCYRKISSDGGYCSTECRSKAEVDRLHWDCAIKYAFGSGWIPRLSSPFSLAVPDPLDRYRVERLILYRRTGDAWEDVGWVGTDFVPESGPVIAHCVHAPWPDGEFAELQYPVDPRLLNSRSRAQIDDYCDAIRVSQSQSIEAYARSYVRPPQKMHELVLYDQVRRANPPPTVSSWFTK